jgi:hypothetical protein
VLEEGRQARHAVTVDYGVWVVLAVDGVVGKPVLIWTGAFWYYGVREVYVEPDVKLCARLIRSLPCTV